MDTGCDLFVLGLRRAMQECVPHTERGCHPRQDYQRGRTGIDAKSLYRQNPSQSHRTPK